MNYQPTAEEVRIHRVTLLKQNQVIPAPLLNKTGQRFASGSDWDGRHTGFLGMEVLDNLDIDSIFPIQFLPDENDPGKLIEFFAIRRF
jgi:hypothetical protein